MRTRFRCRIGRNKKLARLKRSLGLIWMDLFNMKDNFEFLIEDIVSVTLNYFNLVKFQSCISGEKYDFNFGEDNFLT
jgi:hypothetical protein